MTNNDIQFRSGGVTRVPLDDDATAAEQAAAAEEDHSALQADAKGNVLPPLFAHGDASDAYANDKSLYLSFYHLAANREVNFKAFITTFNESFASAWTPNEVFGRNDPIMTFKNTTRKLTLSFQAVAASEPEASRNLVKANTLAKFMYPEYGFDEREGAASRATTLAKPPLMRIAFANLIRDPTKGDSPHASIAGLLVAVDTLTITPSFEDAGFFDSTSRIYPQLIDINLNCTVLHERDLGWDASGGIGANMFGFSNPANAAFPFGAPYSAEQAGLDEGAGEEDVTSEEAPVSDQEEAQASLESATGELENAQLGLGRVLHPDAGSSRSDIRAARQRVGRARRGERQAQRAFRRASSG